jgi:hypothetical protein
LDSHDIAFDNKMASPSLKNEMVVLRNECDVKTESLYVQAITGMAGQTVRNPAGGAGAGTTINIQLRYWTAKGGQEENNKQTMKYNLVLNVSRNELQSLAITGGHFEI